MCKLASTIRRLPLLSAFAAALLLGGCGGVELEGPGFDALGLTGNKKAAEKKVPDRAPLLVPPDRARLPEPVPQVAGVRPENWPTNPESILKAETSEAERKQREYEDKGDWSKKADIDEFEKVMDSALREPGLLGRRKSLGDAYRDSKTYEN